MWQLLAALWRRDYAEVGSSLASPDFSPHSRPLLDAVAAQHRKETLELLSVAYTTISLTDALRMPRLALASANEPSSPLCFTPITSVPPPRPRRAATWPPR